MLKLKYLFENYDLAKECLKRYDHSEKYLDKMLSYFRISSNAIYPFYGNDALKFCFLRLSPAEEKNFKEVESEIRFISWLNEQGYNAMKPYPMKNGKLCDQITTQWGTFNVSSFEEVPGDTLDDAEGSVELVKGYGKMLGELHNLSEIYPYCKERKDHVSFMNEIKERLKQYHAPELLLVFYEKTVQQLKKMSITKENYGLIHYDFEPDNVLYDDDSEEFGVIDFDDAICCWYALDVVRAIDALNDIVDECELSQARKAFLEGYRSVRTFTAQQEESLPLMRDVVKLQEYATILHVLSEPVEEEPDWLIEIKEKLQNRLDRIKEQIS